MAKKNATKKVLKPKLLKKAKVQKSKVELVSYEIKAIIPTGQYANIQPCIVVKAPNLQEAEAYVIPHINKLFGEFLNRGERVNIGVEDKRPITVEEKKPITDVSGTYPKIPSKEGGSAGTSGTVSPEPKVAPKNEAKTDTTPKSVPYTKAESAIISCKSADALKLIEGQIAKSSKLSGAEKVELCAKLGKRADELN